MFENRDCAGEALAKALSSFKGKKPVVYALPRGGLPVASPVAKALDAPLDLIFVRKIGAPGHAELAIGAVVDGAEPTLVIHDAAIRELGVNQGYIDAQRENAIAEIERRRKLYLQDRKPVSMRDRTVIIVDDGLATGSTMEAAIEAARKAEPREIVAAVPTAPRDTIARLERIADRVVCLESPDPFWSVDGQYRHFPQLSDAEVVRLLARNDERRTPEDAAAAK